MRLHNMKEPNIRIEGATPEDCGFVYELRTDPLDEGCYFTKISSYADHQKFWIKNYNNYYMVWLRRKNRIFRDGRKDFRISLIRRYRGQGLRKVNTDEGTRINRRKHNRYCRTNSTSIGLF